MYMIMTASERMPSSCKGRYRKIAVVETDGRTPKMISTRAKGMVRIVEIWRRLNVGKTDKCAFSRAMVEARRVLETIQTEQAG